MTVVARRVPSIPTRTAGETWAAICDLLAEPGSKARTELKAVASLAAELIAEEFTAAAPIVVTGTGGPRVRVYTVHGDQAMELDDDGTSLAFWPCDGQGWAISFPCGPDDIDEIRAALSAYPRFSVRDADGGVDLAAGPGSASRSADLNGPIINIAEMEKP